MVDEGMKRVGRSAPFGYRHNPGTRTMVPDVEEAAVVAVAFKLFLDGISLGAIVRTL